MSGPTPPADGDEEDDEPAMVVPPVRRAGRIEVDHLPPFPPDTAPPPPLGVAKSGSTSRAAAMKTGCSNILEIVG